ncbi:cyclic nucleotide-binding protein [Arthrobacter sp. TPD3018]|uniref:Crp/Fnr family transcriptional regulator n=1 Tax=Bacteria TaxID=2 RepID=UPI000D51B0C5|nr:MULTISPECIES: Crp/Fnr family transcriptional regulator [Bacteria]PVE59034.1 cyclic nucleotide-binding protein [Sphingomonas sp. TPD3009]PVE60557.1 cyclic nucleotide-binding protein [Arthrobacter sp. TPD3018]PVE87233.1 cyclic nucleotide-binding protein [Sphingomonas melonis]
MHNVWAMKMEQFTRFTPEERGRLDMLVAARQRHHDARDDIIAQGAHSDHCHVLLSGFACRYALLPDGQRQIMAFLVPGDLCDAEIFVLDRMDHAIGALVPSVTAMIPASAMRVLLREVSAVSEALWWGTMTDLAVLRERIVDHGRRTADERVAHLLYEMLVRHRIVAETRGDTFDFPITQTDLADATGLTPSHVNRVLRRLRDEGIIVWHSRVLTVVDPAQLKQLGQFNADYLHLQRTESGDPAVLARAGDLVAPHHLDHLSMDFGPTNRPVRRIVS